MRHVGQSWTRAPFDGSRRSGLRRARGILPPAPPDQGAPWTRFSQRCSQSANVPSRPAFSDADLLESLGGIPTERVLVRPAPGEATEADWNHIPEDLRQVCELIDGTLVRKAMAYPESVMMIVLGGLLREYLRKNPIAIVAGADGATRFPGGQLRMPDLSVVLRSRLPQGATPLALVADVVPDLAVEILSPGNTAQELESKVALFCRSGVRLVWIVDIRKRTVEVLARTRSGCFSGKGVFSPARRCCRGSPSRSATCSQG